MLHWRIHVLIEGVPLNLRDEGCEKKRVAADHTISEDKRSYFVSVSCPAMADTITSAAEGNRSG